MGFDAGAVVEPLDWDFTAYAGPDAKGVTPEPTDKQIMGFSKALAVALGIDPESAGDSQAVADAMAQLSGLDADGQLARFDELRHAVADLCQGSPTIEQIEALPFRVLQAYLGWLFGQIASPTLPTGGMSS